MISLEHPSVQLTCNVMYLSQIPETLLLGQTDLAITDRPIDRADVENHLIGHEQYVFTESTRVKSRHNVFLDISPSDETTVQFFRIQKKKPGRYLRSFMNDEWGIMVGTELGIGRAVKPRHMISPHSHVRIVPGFKSLIKPVYLHYRRQPYYTVIQRSAIDLLIRNARTFLGG